MKDEEIKVLDNPKNIQLFKKLIKRAKEHKAICISMRVDEKTGNIIECEEVNFD